MFCMHFGARISHLRAHLAFGFWLWLHLASLGFTWLMARGFWLLVLVSLGFFGRSLHLALGVRWVLVL